MTLGYEIPAGLFPTMKSNVIATTITKAERNIHNAKKEIKHYEELNKNQPVKIYKLSDLDKK
jgi:hypothetical protein